MVPEASPASPRVSPLLSNLAGRPSKPPPRPTCATSCLVLVREGDEQPKPRAQFPCIARVVEVPCVELSLTFKPPPRQVP